MVKLAFYRGGATLLDKAIRLWTLGPYSHVELLIDDTSFSSVPGIGTRYLIYPLRKDGEWDYLDIPMTQVEQSYMWNWCMTEMNCPYDWKGIFLAQVLGLNREDPHKWFCSEFCTAALKIAGQFKVLVPHQMSPNSLYRVISDYQALHNPPP